MNLFQMDSHPEITDHINKINQSFKFKQCGSSCITHPRFTSLIPRSIFCLNFDIKENNINKSLSIMFCVNNSKFVNTSDTRLYINNLNKWRQNGLILKSSKQITFDGNSIYVKTILKSEKTTYYIILVKDSNGFFVNWFSGYPLLIYPVNNDFSIRLPLKDDGKRNFKIQFTGKFMDSPDDPNDLLSNDIEQIYNDKIINTIYNIDNLR